ncbi:MAG: type II toxin-antitoxin system HicA family toxin [Acidobacteria bacterium]|nr:type II toxin-antitoxin system HicA family toxin [Acidobacteriota bacterium]
MKADGWSQFRRSGSHRVFRRESRKGSVTVPGAWGIELSASTLASIVRPASRERRSR